MSVVTTALCVYLVLTLGPVGLLKRGREVRAALEAHGEVPRRFVPFVGSLVGPAEIATAVWLASGVVPFAAGVTACAMFAAFMVYRGRLYAKGEAARPVTLAALVLLGGSYVAGIRRRSHRFTGVIGSSRRARNGDQL